jgi:hypothetical protein
VTPGGTARATVAFEAWCLSACPAQMLRYGIREILMLKALIWIVVIIFVIGLLVVSGVLSLIF